MCSKEPGAELINSSNARGHEVSFSTKEVLCECVPVPGGGGKGQNCRVSGRVEVKIKVSLALVLLRTVLIL